jgi:two-component system chemotaxis response regulator CheB
VSRAPDVVAIGTSTGGPNALEQVFRSLGDLAVPVVVVQHMPPVFTKILAERLDSKSAMHVCEARAGMPVEPGCAYVAPGDHHLVVTRTPVGNVRIELDRGPAENSCRPAVDVLFRSVAATFGAAALGVVMTGMGQDGLRGSQDLVDAGAEVIAQDEATSVVWGMPGFVVRGGLASEVVPLDQIAAAIDRRVRRRTPARAGSAPKGAP